MSEDSFTETTYEGWGSRIMSSIKGVIVGVVLFLASFAVLFWNEGRAVKTAKSLAEGRGAVVSVKADKVDPASENKLVHLSGEATTEETLTDEEFGVSATAIRLVRNAEMYQWKESSKTTTRKRIGGGRERKTTYTYAETWSSSVINSSNFNKPTGHENPGQMEFSGQKLQAENVTVGAFRLPKSLIDSIGGPKALAADPEKLPEGLKERAKPYQGGYYIGKEPGSPAIGDLKINFQVVEPATVSLISQQVGDTFQPYQTEAGDPINMLRMGQASAKQMFTEAEKANVMFTWILRLVGFIVMAVGIGMVFQPLAVLADVLPFLGDLLRMGIALFAAIIALPLTIITIAIAWLFYRPVLGIVLILVAVGLFLGIKKLRAAKQAEAAATAGAAGGEPPAETPAPPAEG